jgi:hypothetical protein
VQFDLVLDRLRGWFVGQMGMVTGTLTFSIDQMLASATVMCCGKLELFRGEFVVIFKVFHPRPQLLVGITCVNHQPTRNLWRHYDDVLLPDNGCVGVLHALRT